MPRYEILSEDAMATLETGWRRLMTEIGVEFMDDRALDLFREAGQKVEGNAVFLDPDFVLEQVAKAPSEFDLQARNPANSVHIGGDSMAFGAVYGPPFVREGDVRRDGTMEDFRNFSPAGPELRRCSTPPAVWSTSPTTRLSTAGTSTWSTRCRR